MLAKEEADKTAKVFAPPEGHLAECSIVVHLLEQTPSRRVLSLAHWYGPIICANISENNLLITYANRSHANSALNEIGKLISQEFGLETPVTVKMTQEDDSINNRVRTFFNSVLK